MAALKIIGIYKITSPSGRVYIGQSKDIRYRRHSYKAMKKRGQRLVFNSFNKYGFDAHKFEIICECDEGELNELEIKYIKIYDSLNPKKGMNLRDGGKRGSFSEEIRKLLSQKKKDKLRTDRGYYLKLVAQLTGKGSKGEDNPMWGKGRRVSQFDWDGNFIKEHISTIQAGKAMGDKSAAPIYSTCKRKYAHNSAYGFVWRYSDDCEVENGKLKERLWRKKVPKCKNGGKENRFKGGIFTNGVWRAKMFIMEGGNTVGLGTYKTELDAVRAINIFWKESSGEEFPLYDIKNPFSVPPKLSKGGNHKRGTKPVVKMNLKGELVGEYRSISAAVKSIGMKSAYRMLQVLSGKIKEYNGFRWSYKK